MKIITAATIACLVVIALSVSAQAAPNQQTRPECSIKDKDSQKTIESHGSAHGDPTPESACQL